MRYIVWMPVQSSFLLQQCYYCSRLKRRRRGEGEKGRRGEGEKGRRGDGEMGRWGDGEMGRWGDGEGEAYPRNKSRL